MSDNQNSKGSLVSQLDHNFAFDSLAYHDGLPPKDQKQAANKLVDDELKRFPKVKNYLAGFPMESEKLLTPALKNLLKMAETNTVSLISNFDMWKSLFLGDRCHRWI